jgi:hypothetical protein
MKDSWKIAGLLAITTLGLYLISRRISILKGNNKSRNKVKAKDWSDDNDFFTNSDGKNLSSIAKNVGITLKRNTGLNGFFNESKYKTYKDNPSVYWAVYDINEDKLIASSKNANKNVYGASVPKVCVAAAAFSNNNGVLTKDSQYGDVIKLLVKSDNNVWTGIQNIAGGANAVNDWSKKMGYNMQPARGGGNNCNAIDMCKFWNDVCRGNFAGADNIFRISSSCQTSSSRSKKCMPSNVYLGGKTGTYQKSNHDTCYIQVGDRFYSISVLTELGQAGSDVIAQMFRGLYNEYID